MSTSSSAERSGGIGGQIAAAKSRFARLRERYAWLDHAVRAFAHFSKVQSNMLAGAVTYFGMLSIFPIIALAFAVVGYVARVYPDAQQQIVTALQDSLPGLFSELDPEKLKSAAVAASLIGVVGFLYSGLGWLAALRTALQSAFEVPPKARRNAIVSKLVDLAALITIGVILVASVAASSVVTSLTETILDAIGLGSSVLAKLVLSVLGIALGAAASTVLFFVMYRVLANPNVPSKYLWRGAVVPAVIFEILKLVATYVITSASSNPIYGSFAITVALLVWINYFARITMLGAAWAMTAETTKAKVAVLERGAVMAPKRDVAGERARAGVFAGAILGASAVAFVDLVRRVRADRDD